MTLGVLVLALTGFATAVTLRYRDGLESDLRHRLTEGAQALRIAPADQFKQLAATLALEGIDVRISRAAAQPPKPGAQKLPPPLKPPSLRSAGPLLVLEESFGGPRVYAFAVLIASRVSVDGPVRRLIVAEIIGGGLALALASTLLWLGLGAALEPLAQVGRVAQSITLGDRGRRLRPRRPNSELGRMAASFDAMVDALDVAVDQARESESAMRRFLADASHELRTPIAALQATAETLLREQPARPQRDRLEAQLARDSARLGRLVDDLLNLARLEASEPQRQHLVDLAEVAQGAAREARVRATQARIDFTHHGSTVVLGDADALARALRNLLENAAAASGRTGHIQLDVQRSDADVIASVSDDGPGVPPDQRERIFQGFVHLPVATANGVGLGLAIARRIAQQHHGELTCEDVTSGARFVCVYRR